MPGVAYIILAGLFPLVWRLYTHLHKKKNLLKGVLIEKRP